MKKFLSVYILIVFGSAFAINSDLNAQTYISVTDHFATNFPNCTVPDSVYFTYAVFTYNYTPADSVHFHVDFGDGNFIDTMEAQGVANVTTLDSSYFMHVYTAAGIYFVTYMATMPDGNADTSHDVVMVAGICNNVTGKVYVDVNHNCVFDGSDIAVSGEPLLLNYTNYSQGPVYANALGDYSFSACPGYTYTLLTDTNFYSPPVHFTCGTYEGMAVTPSPSVTQDLVILDSAFVQILSANDSSSFIAGQCAPASGHFQVYGEVGGYYSTSDSVSVYVNFGDGNDTTLNQGVYFSQGASSFWATWIPHTYTAPGNYNVMYIVTAPNGMSDTVIHMNEETFLDTCGNVQGQLYVDNNSNCIYDAGDSAIAFAGVELLNTSTNTYHFTLTDSSGHYNFSVSPGNYDLNVSSGFLNYTALSSSCPASNLYNINVTAATTLTNDFGMICPATFDLSGTIFLGGGIFPTMPGVLLPYITNQSCNAIAGSVQLILDPLVHFIGTCDTTINPAVNGDTLSWNFTSASAYQYWYYSFWQEGCLSIIGDSSLQPGDSVCFTMIVNPIIGDANPANNIVHRCVPAFVALDPNTKEVSPAGSGPQGYIGQLTPLNYSIEFQNTGTAAAQNIFVLDTLDADLDISTLVITGSSHYMQPTILPGNIIRFSFPNINLPDSSSDELHSHGWLSYRIIPKNNLPDGTMIENRAGIYFDFNPPVFTNSTLNTIYDPASVQEISSPDISVFPNPASSSFDILFGTASSANIHLTDLAGKEVMTEYVTGTRLTVDIHTLPSGIYFLRVETASGVAVHKIIIQHQN